MTFIFPHLNMKKRDTVNAQQFEDLIIWQKARLLVRGIVTKMVKVHDFGFRDQIQRAAVST